MSYIVIGWCTLSLFLAASCRWHMWNTCLVIQTVDLPSMGHSMEVISILIKAIPCNQSVKDPSGWTSKIFSSDYLRHLWGIIHSVAHQFNRFVSPAKVSTAAVVVWPRALYTHMLTHLWIPEEPFSWLFNPMQKAVDNFLQFSQVRVIWPLMWWAASLVYHPFQWKTEIGKENWLYVSVRMCFWPIWLKSRTTFHPQYEWL